MKILLVTNKTYNNREDLGYYYLYIPLSKLGYQVQFYDIANPKEKDFLQTVKSFSPDLLFCCLTGNKQLMVSEPDLEIISSITQSGNIKTFNWFCDDTWRFDNWSSKVCFNFTCCSTPEPSYIQKYKDIGYSNIILGGWHANKDVFLKQNKDIFCSFIGTPYGDRQKIIKILQNVNIGFVNKHGISNKEMWNYLSKSQIGLSFSINPNNAKTQMKQRPFEIIAGESLCLSEYHSDMEYFFEVDKEIITFSSTRELFDKIKYFKKNLEYVKKIANAGYKRFLKEHNSEIRIKLILEQIKAI